VILDPNRRVATASRLFARGAEPALVVCRAEAATDTPSAAPEGAGAGMPTGPETSTARMSGRADARASSGERISPDARTEIIPLPLAGPEGFDPRAVLGALRERGLRRVLVEGGGITVSRFLAARVLDRLHVTVAPLLIGSGRAALSLPPIETLGEALRPPCRHFRLGDDILFDLELEGV
jgi:riboflavin biosynthesis pyrimidine reductase